MRLRMIALLSVLALTTAASGVQSTDYKFSFGTGTPPAGFTQVNVDTMYTVERGYGFEPSTNLPTPGQGTMPIVAPALRAGESLISSDRAFLFSAAVPEGNYRVTLTLGDPDADCTTTVKAEARRLMLEHLTIPKGAQVTRSFVVHVRRPQVRPGVAVKLDPREPGSLTWDNKLSLQFSDAHTALRQLEIHRADDVCTVFLCSDSTVTDQPIEPYGGWGQMLPRWFNDKVAVANYAESGQTLKAFQRQRRWDKVLSLLKGGDYVFMQFGNNDMQSRGHNALWPADDHDEDWSATFSDPNTDYQDILKDWSAQVKAKGAIPVVVSPYTKARRGEPDPAGLRTYPAAAQKAAKDSNTPFLNLTAISTAVLTALGPQVGAQAYVDGQHTTSYGAYLNARSVAFGIRELRLDLAKHLTEDAVFDPRNPLPLRADFAVPR
ncbi:MAG: rhamnogalacturonan acetylesterase [Phycisphaerae bacterium]|nr:rhamnogalacturonan acetylesterase [Phycisphaerae bacterium]